MSKLTSVENSKLKNDTKVKSILQKYEGMKKYCLQNDISSFGFYLTETEIGKERYEYIISTLISKYNIDSDKEWIYTSWRVMYK